MSVRGHRPGKRKAGTAGSVVILTAALTLLVSATGHERAVELLTGPQDSSAARPSWCFAAIVVSQVAILIVMFAHVDMRMSEDADESTLRPDSFLTETLGLIALFSLWGICSALLEVAPAGAPVHVLDLLGRAAAMGAVVGLVPVAFRGTWRYAHAFPLLPSNRRREAIGVASVMSAVWIGVTLRAIAVLLTL